MLWSHSSDVTWLRYTANKKTSSKCSGWNVRKTVSLNSRQSNFSILSQIQIGCAKNSLTKIKYQSRSHSETHWIPSFLGMLNFRAVYLNHVTSQEWRPTMYRCVNPAAYNTMWRHNYVTTSDVIVCEKLIFGSVVRKTTSLEPRNIENRG